MVRVVNIARCPLHGLHGEREECFVCAGAVEQVPMVPVADVVEVLAQAFHPQNPTADHPADVIERVLGEASSRPRLPSRAVGRLRLMHELVELGSALCAYYSEPDKWLIGRCDCRRGLRDVESAAGDQTGCPEIRDVLELARGGGPLSKRPRDAVLPVREREGRAVA